MRICIVGTGYVGLVTGACLADVGNHVFCVDRDQQKVAALKDRQVPIFEPGLDRVLERNIEEKRIFFTTDLKDGLKSSEVAFITVDTPPDAKGRADLTNVLAVADELGRLIEAPTIVVTKSTVPVGTTLKVKERVTKGLQSRGLDPNKLLFVANNPEFLKEGGAVADFMKPDRVIVGVEDPHVAEKLHELYQPFMRKQDRFLVMDIPSSELCKYAANAMLATRISFMNELGRLCERVGADINAIRDGIGRDPRIGPEFLYAGLGYGGSCFPKDMKALIQLGRDCEMPQSVVESADVANDHQREWFWKKISDALKGDFRGKSIALWGLAFKPETDDVRSAPSLYIIHKLLDAGAKIRAYDPVAVRTAKQAMSDRAAVITWCRSSYDALKQVDALIVCTEWREFRSPDFDQMRALMRRPLIIDGRLLYEPKDLHGKGFKLVSIGRRL